MKEKLWIERREFIAWAVSGAAGVHALSISSCLKHDSKPKIARKRVVAPIFESATGVLSMTERDQLWKLVEKFASTFNMAGLLSRSEFDQIVALKTKQPPSYLEEYKNAIGTFRQANEDIDAIIREANASADDATSKTYHTQVFVLKEFFNLLLSRGGFKQFGYTNFRGYVAGSQNRYQISRFEVAR